MNNELYLIIIFVMAMMLGYELIKKIPPTLHTPLMSGTNAISGIVIIGSILVITSTSDLVVNILGFISLLLSSINVFGGFIVTDRMLEMFKKPKNKDKK
ncbi:MAG: NAD(P) transhydrogenase subunit alpha [Chloroflexota bacterium]|nr:NAD(P) transhydrogenase subunit alpha [Chloroflexota bacterium]|tara:strand:+ start:135 stop:431 length:297 start_codon:yes stop_codon:yes gene_type:complete